MIILLKEKPNLSTDIRTRTLGFGSSYSLQSSCTWCYKLSTPGFGDVLTFFSVEISLESCWTSHWAVPKTLLPGFLQTLIIKVKRFHLVPSYQIILFLRVWESSRCFSSVRCWGRASSWKAIVTLAIVNLSQSDHWLLPRPLPPACSKDHCALENLQLSTVRPSIDQQIMSNQLINYFIFSWAWGCSLFAVICFVKQWYCLYCLNNAGQSAIENVAPLWVECCWWSG